MRIESRRRFFIAEPSRHSPSLALGIGVAVRVVRAAVHRIGRGPLLATAVAFGVLMASASAAWAGGGPENVLLIVNPESADSLAIANHYVRLRDIPQDNLLFVPWNPREEMTDVDVFRTKILMPILQAIYARGLMNQVDYIVYSADFPWGIRLYRDIEKFKEKLRQESAGATKDGKGREWPVQFTAVGSINGLTYLWQGVAAVHPMYFSLQSNHYMRLPIPEQSEATTAGFRGNRWYNRKGQVVETKEYRYFLSAMLGVTAGRGNSRQEVLSYLERSAAADGTKPKGTIYFVENDDVRSRVRQGGYPRAVQSLQKMGIDAEIIKGTVPLQRDDVQGVMMGTAEFDWKASGSTILPGALCDNFTSFGGAMNQGAKQTPLSEFLRYGAAGANGTVTEPYAMADKFASPLVQVHYAKGCTLAEAYYQSIYGPYQQLIVGDPLCRPWADIPRVSVDGVEAGANLKGSVRITPSARSADILAIDHFELFVDNLRVMECKPGGEFSLDTTKYPDGYHQLRIVAVGSPPIETQGRVVMPVKLANYGRRIEASLATTGPIQASKPLTVSVDSPGAEAIVTLYGSHVVGKLKGEKGQIEIPAKTFGVGRVLLRVASLGRGGVAGNAIAEPLELTVVE